MTLSHGLLTGQKVLHKFLFRNSLFFLFFVVYVRMLETLTSIDLDALYNAFATIAAVLFALLAAWKKKQEEKTQAFFDPDNTTVMTPTASTPDRAWKMSQETKDYLTVVCHPEEAESILTQIEEAEAAGYVDYKLVVSGGYYNITYGLISGGRVIEEPEVTGE